MPEIIALIATAVMDGLPLAGSVLGLYLLAHLAGLILGFRRSPAEFASDVWDRRHQLRRHASRAARPPAGPRSRT